MNEELKRTEFNRAFCKKRKTGVTVRPRSLNPGKAITMAICPIICSFYYLACALMHDVACEFACAVGCAETISANVLNSYPPSSSSPAIEIVLAENVTDLGNTYEL